MDTAADRVVMFWHKSGVTVWEAYSGQNPQIIDDDDNIVHLLKKLSKGDWVSSLDKVKKGAKYMGDIICLVHKPLDEYLTNWAPIHHNKKSVSSMSLES